MFCPACGKQLQEGAQFCNSCGAKVAELGNRQVQSRELAPSPGKKPKRRKFVPIAVVAIALAAVVCVGAAIATTKRSPSTSEVSPTPSAAQVENDSSSAVTSSASAPASTSASAAASQAGAGKSNEAESSGESQELALYLQTDSSKCSGFYLYHGGELYTLESVNYNADASTGYSKTTVIWANAKNLSRVISGTPYPAGMIGVSLNTYDALPTLSDGDEIRYYSSGGKVADLDLVPVVRTGYGTLLRRDYKNDLQYGDPDRDSSMTKTYIDQSYDAMVADSKGNEHALDDIYGFAAGEQVTVSWYEGTKYREIALTADYPCYAIDPALPTYQKYYVDYVEDGSVYRIAGELTKDGYAVYDISNVSPGTYMTSGGGIIEIPA